MYKWWDARAAGSSVGGGDVSLRTTTTGDGETLPMEPAMTRGGSGGRGRNGRKSAGDEDSDSKPRHRATVDTALMATECITSHTARSRRLARHLIDGKFVNDLHPTPTTRTHDEPRRKHQTSPTSYPRLKHRTFSN